MFSVYSPSAPVCSPPPGSRCSDAQHRPREFSLAQSRTRSRTRTHGSEQNNAIDRSVAASEALYTAFAPIPESRDDDEEYDAGPQSAAGKLLEGMRKQLLKGPHNPIDANALSAIIDAAVHGDHVDDRKLLVRSLFCPPIYPRFIDSLIPTTAREGFIHHVQPSRRASQ